MLKMQAYIANDLIKYVISDYIIYDVLVIIENTNFNIRKNTIIIYDNFTKMNNTFKTSTIIIYGILKTISNYNYKGICHGYEKYYFQYTLIRKILYINDIKIKTIECKKIENNYVLNF
jgi:hypothetical protein